MSGLTIWFVQANTRRILHGSEPLSWSGSAQRVVQLPGNTRSGQKGVINFSNGSGYKKEEKKDPKSLAEGQKNCDGCGSELPPKEVSAPRVFRPYTTLFARPTGRLRNSVRGMRGMRGKSGSPPPRWGLQGRGGGKNCRVLKIVRGCVGIPPANIAGNPR